ncbi:hypothetical protein ENKNEFLB_02969 [Nocardioides aquaticus]|uniref:GNAT family N-acetyltransferase n=1 Tax=Nocardioides aquaticus TaxID=160826 RepID=A0ABX8EL61_9ACTN|nr:hypothetical protein [Nocardioides aquaticus]QVT80570.1 hypothetical protein ENKNEFLB_02969 [Nocardioides aquaticus]
MNLPEQPATFRPAEEGDLAWWWRCEDAAGAEVDVPEPYAGQRFANQGDAESWVGEVFAELAAEGVDAVTLFEDQRRVYGPMSLHP